MNHYEALIKHLSSKCITTGQIPIDLTVIPKIVRYIEQVEKEATAKGVEKAIELRREPENECCNEPEKIYKVTSLSEEKTKYFKEYGNAVKYLHEYDHCITLKAVFIE